MPGRKIPLVNDKIYHIFNKTIDHKKVFEFTASSYLFLDLLKYYRSNNATVSYSKFKKMPPKLQGQIINKISIKNSHKVRILAYCLMPNHFHLLLQQLKANGISKYIADVLNSFTRFTNTKTVRNGPIFLTQFKAVEIVTREQLIHGTRYIHLNPYTTRVIKIKEQLVNYQWSSLHEYAKKGGIKLISTDMVLTEFKHNRESLIKFTLDHAETQKKLGAIKDYES
ncbi:hypothetical protein A3C23_02310 [Candidatus Roizmanbacteria bacterium RIFCSPHIGHO2_02_FULL_37_13b]|uniref:Transposase IS200-like domain-containing protein n=1 Tax=Candidatus Roizmanbacteria bacterium RIFCSPLOWO2_02_FULL_36_11 TaxID=1802071 RepID=A0A1F7JJ15_9BACT|nr:MAG: hypothetical protein A3C23_02310 [Candidatus Roizmanbacteria bacterium RIFCSPHIGHO2_02_FULL_37_13b]OGK55602.1 MAG: hypothetical protein A3H78_01465 [Candidatus Roizmanbacteria bacterium RIFCSPLOWO2_02_FULL_36_11]